MRINFIETHKISAVTSRNNYTATISCYIPITLTSMWAVGINLVYPEGIISKPQNIPPNEYNYNLHEYH